MKRLLLIGAIAVASGNGSYAADMPVKAPPLPAEPGWVGYYFGLNAGGIVGAGRSNDRVDFAPPGAPLAGVFPGIVNPIQQPSYSRGATGGVFGGQLGINWQSGNWVYGLEGDIDWVYQHD